MTGDMRNVTGAGGERRGGPGQRLNRGRQGGRDNVLFRQDGFACSGDFERVVCCVDDTDDTSGLTSTGNVAEMLAREWERLGCRVILGVTRHQLLLAEGIAYTSHNSAMAFEAAVPAGSYEAVAEAAVEVVERLSASGSDPGLCLVRVGRLVPEAEAARALARFGRRAQCEVVSKEEAYDLVPALCGVSLSEHGGTGAGVIGALAGAGLRLGGADGRFRGQWDLPELLGVGDAPDGAAGCVPVLAAAELERRLAGLTGGPVLVLDAAGMPVDRRAPVALSRKAKPLLRQGALVLLAEPEDGLLQLFCQEQSDGPALAGASPPQVCERFMLDADAEERLHSVERHCRNCQHRRWHADGYRCQLAS